MRVALVSRELYPLGGGGIGQFVAAAARVLSRIAEVTVITTSVFEERYQLLRAREDPELPDVRVAFVPEPTVEEAEPWYHVMHCYEARVLERLKELYADAPPDLIEFPDFLGEAFVPLQAAEALDPFFAETRLCVRLHTTAEMCELLDGYLKRDLGSEAVHQMERYALAHADRVIWQGGDVLGTYRRFYGATALAPDIRIRYPYAGPRWEEGVGARAEEGGGARAEEGGGPRGERQDPLRILYAGRLERRKGVHNLVQALTGSEREDFRLTLLGGDTNTAPLGASMRSQLELMIADDERIELGQVADRAAVAEAIRAHDLVVIPSLWECWPYAALEPLHLNRPVLATPVGGLVELVQPGRSGWLATGTDAASLQDALERVLDSRDQLQALVRAGTPAATARALSDEREILDGYQSLLAAKPRRARDRRRRGSAKPPLVSAIVPYYRSARYVAEAIESLLAQTYPRLEIVLVSDGSFEEEDRVLAELTARRPVVVVSQMNQGLGAARNLGIEQSRGRYVLPLDCDNAVEPEFVERCVAILESRPEVAYVTSWSRYVEDDGTPRRGNDLGYEPLGNYAQPLLARENVAGDAAAVIRRRLFDAGFWYSTELTSYEDWALYRELSLSGHYGVVIPERLLRYRVRADSMQALIAQPLRERLEAEIEALVRERRLRWTASPPGDRQPAAQTATDQRSSTGG